MRTSFKSTLIALAAVAALGTTAASAATITGRITSIDTLAHRLTLRHHVFHWPKAMKVGGLHKGEHVRLSYHWSHGKRWVTAYRPIAGKLAAASHRSMHPETKTY